MPKQGKLRWITWLCLLLLAVSSITVPAKGSAEADPDRLLQQSLNRLVDKLLEEPNASGTVVGYHVISLDDGRQLAGFRETVTLMPHGAFQLWTAAAALEAWSPDQTFATGVFIDGPVRGGVLRGDVVIQGGGDPLLETNDFRLFARALKKEGIRRVQGDVVVDDSRFDDRRLGTNWMWDRESEPSHAPIGALSVNDNTVEVTVKPEKRRRGNTPQVIIEPAGKAFEVVNRAQVVSGDDADIQVERRRATDTFVVTGTIGRSHPALKVKRAVGDPAGFAGAVMKEALTREGIRLYRQSSVRVGEKPETARRIVSHSSPPVGDWVPSLLSEQSPWVAEMTLKQLGADRRGEGSAARGLDVVRAFAREQAGVDGTWQPRDGSGNSRMGVVAPRHMSALLKTMDQHPEGERFFARLPVAGQDGLLQDRMAGTPAAGNLRAYPVGEKEIGGLTGVVTSASGERLAFSVMVNGALNRSAVAEMEDAFGVALASYPETPGSGSMETEEEEYPLSDVLDPLLEQASFDGILHGVMVRSLDRGEVMYQRNAQSLLTPASNTKLFTSAAALAALGEDYRFRTDLYLDGKVRRGVLKGDLVLRGGGDPTLATEGNLKVQEGPTLDEVVADLKRAGIRRVDGDIRVDDSFFSGPEYGSGWTWDNESAYYQSQIASLAINRGTVRFDYLPGERVGDPIRLEMTPATAYVDVEAEVVTGEAGYPNTLRIERERGTNRIRLSGSLPADFTGDYTRVPVEDPSLYTGTVLKEMMEREGISFQRRSGVKKGQAPAGVPDFTYHSPVLAEVVTYLNKVSDNFYAEMILQTLGRKNGGDGSASAGVEEVEKWAKEWGIQTPFRLRDGSGLTRYNLLTPEQLVTLLEAQAEEAYFEAFVESIPLAGVDGTLRTRMRGTPAEGNLRGKTGSLTHVSSLSGYVETRDGERLVYAIMMNGYTPESERALQDRIGAQMAGFSRQPGEDES
ncbi:D-alanyl-D-alanine carboxypeptidase/D-alanyl-D-alanine endopeptidase [Desmospora profundinema]|uniref:PBP4 family serine-type D-alanyl-D-alanine carboxypeptidase n=1 Tax=Desmospora profundinema TaxID=1571184 RepID=A0ABU1IIZ7_9BACL|nr:D-alanyl-D-alanine carboxypeptidase/D-alanyl-D-alanine-endopeptidase [Desmospora profundinema]MDR6224727.1 PBP4 family serine-type D-alanyl-D-alanine carboxypeptidase [Desmospora profundinema]